MKTLSEDCEFGESRNSLIKDLIIIGLRDEKLQERLLSEPDITLEQVCKRGQANEVTNQQARKIQATNREISSINQLSNQNTSNIRKDLIKYCKFCFGNNKQGNYPTWGQFCNNCQKLGILQNVALVDKNPSRPGLNRQNSHVIHPSNTKLINWKKEQIHLQTLVLNSFRELSFMMTQIEN